MQSLLSTYEYEWSDNDRFQLLLYPGGTVNQYCDDAFKNSFAWYVSGDKLILVDSKGDEDIFSVEKADRYCIRTTCDGRIYEFYNMSFFGSSAIRSNCSAEKTALSIVALVAEDKYYTREDYVYVELEC